ncbi:hypothetical protein BGW80DRAFT_889033 [Lactifluus volemus]|nr:hypothetical protein BGW80DRAFT_889033 [Lactifluus volemus]
MPVVMSIAMTFLFVLLPHMPHRPHHHWHFVITSLALLTPYLCLHLARILRFCLLGIHGQYFRFVTSVDVILFRSDFLFLLSFLPHYQSFFCLATTSSMLDSGRYQYRLFHRTFSPGAVATAPPR